MASQGSLAPHPNVLPHLARQPAAALGPSIVARDDQCVDSTGYDSHSHSLVMVDSTMDHVHARTVETGQSSTHTLVT